jgi:hypothetical protein
MVGIHLAVQNGDARRGPDGGHDGVHLGGVAPLGEIRHALDNRPAHGITSPLIMVSRTLLVPK